VIRTRRNEAFFLFLIDDVIRFGVGNSLLQVRVVYHIKYCRNQRVPVPANIRTAGGLKQDLAWLSPGRFTSTATLMPVLVYPSRILLLRQACTRRATSARRSRVRAGGTGSNQYARARSSPRAPDDVATSPVRSSIVLLSRNTTYIWSHYFLLQLWRGPQASACNPCKHNETAHTA
jgi:hypothetical protein